MMVVEPHLIGTPGGHTQITPNAVYERIGREFVPLDYKYKGDTVVVHSVESMLEADIRTYQIKWPWRGV